MLSLKPEKDFLLLILLTILLNLFILFEMANSLRNVFGLLFIIFFPGYVLQATLFTAQNDLKIVVRIVLSFALSIAIVSLLGLALNFTPWGIKLHPFIIILSLYISAVSLIGIYRRSKLPEEQRFKIKRIKPTTLINFIGSHKVFSVVLVGAVVFAMFSVYSLVSTPRYGGFTEFYLLTSDKKAQDYSEMVKINKDIEFILGVANFESEGSQYTIKIQLDGLTKMSIGPFYLEHGKKFQETVDLSPPADYIGSKIDCVLLKNDNKKPYRTLHMWISKGNGELS